MKLHHGDCLTILRSLEASSLDSLVTDPPAGISFMGKAWDGDKGGRDQWVKWMTEVMAECLRVLKPGAHGLVWAIPRTSHWTMTALENAGFEVRDVVTHLFGTGFPKSLDVSKAIDKAAGAERGKGKVGGSGPFADTGRCGGCGKPYFSGNPCQCPRHDLVPVTPDAKQWQGFGTALKPACEFWVLVRKPCSEKTVAANVLKWGCGALNIDGCRIDPIGMDPRVGKGISYGDGDRSTKFGQIKTNMIAGNPTGRFPANLVLDEDAAQALDEQSGTLKSGDHNKPFRRTNRAGYSGPTQEMSTFIRPGDSGGASRFFYCPKASKSDKGADNSHPTVKSTALMSYLIRLVTPPNGVVLDPFMGSGSTGVAAKREGFGFLGIEQDPDYVECAEKRLGG